MDGLRAVDVMTILHEKVAYLSGGRDQRPGPILTFPASTRRDRLKHDDYRPLLQYLMQIPRWEWPVIILLLFVQAKTTDFSHVPRWRSTYLHWAILESVTSFSSFAVGLYAVPEQGTLTFFNMPMVSSVFFRASLADFGKTSQTSLSKEETYAGCLVHEETRASLVSHGKMAVTIPPPLER